MASSSVFHPGLGTETAANGSANATNLDSASRVYIFNGDSGDSLITLTGDTVTDVHGTFTLGSKQNAVIAKFKTEKVFAGNANVKFTKVGF